MRKYGFAADHITTLLDGEATREAILAALGDSLADGKKVARDDRVLVFFAGHGVTRKLPSGKSQGYIVPVDAALQNYQSQAISMTNFQDASDAIPAKHLFFVMDACYSGLALTRAGGGARSGDRRQYLMEITRRSAREVLTAGGGDEQVADNGPERAFDLHLDVAAGAGGARRPGQRRRDHGDRAGGVRRPPACRRCRGRRPRSATWRGARGASSCSCCAPRTSS